MKRISTHVLDLHRGTPAANVPVRLERKHAGGWLSVSSVLTDPDGRCPQLLPNGEVLPGVYRLSFDTAAYFSALNIDSLYSVVEITFHVREHESHLHIPLLLTANGYTTYRGS